jgi:uncharacterized protein (TIGR02001 family)
MAAAALAPAARAQVAVSVEADSDDRYRGVSLSDGQPTMSVSAAYDATSGLYGGVTGTAVATRHSGVQPLGYVVYAGYAGRLPGGASWDLGASDSQDLVYLEDKRYAQNYAELYAGVSKGDVSAHLYYSPQYLTDSGAFYADVDGAWRPASGWRLFVHAGVLAVLKDDALAYHGQTRWDARLGVARQFGRAEARLAWTTTWPTPVYPPDVRQGRDTLVLSLAWFF